MAYNILIVDDSATVRAVLTKTMYLAGIDVGKIDEAPNGRVALEKLQNGWFDLVFTDINMPEFNGLQLIDSITKDDMLSDLPVIVISTDGSTTRIEEVKSKGVRAYVRKPFTPESIRNVVNGVLVAKDGQENGNA